MEQGLAEYPGSWQCLRMRADTRIARSPQPPGDQVHLAVDVFRMLADPTRVRLLWALLDRELAVNELADAVDKPSAGESQHLAKLRLARLVHSRRQGTQIFYRIENTHVGQLVRDAIYHADHASPGIPDHHRANSGTSLSTPADVGADSA
jgi:DNA-binding transcriptional ArsR family regulator